MFLLEYFNRSLTKLRYLDFESGLLHSGHDFIEGNILLISQEVKYIVRCDRRRPTLFKAKNKINPLRERSRYIIGLERSSHFEQKVLRTHRPFRDDNIINNLPFRSRPHLKFLTINQKLTLRRIKLRNQFFEIRRRVHRTIIRTLYTSEDSITWRKHSVLDSDDELGDFTQ